MCTNRECKGETSKRRTTPPLVGEPTKRGKQRNTLARAYTQTPDRIQSTATHERHRQIHTFRGSNLRRGAWQRGGSCFTLLLGGPVGCASHSAHGDDKHEPNGDVQETSEEAETSRVQSARSDGAVHTARQIHMWLSGTRAILKCKTWTLSTRMWVRTTAQTSA